MLIKLLPNEFYKKKLAVLCSCCGLYQQYVSMQFIIDHLRSCFSETELTIIMDLPRSCSSKTELIINMDFSRSCSSGAYRLLVDRLS